MTICSQVGRLNLYLLHLTVRRGVARVWVWGRDWDWVCLPAWCVAAADALRHSQSLSLLYMVPHPQLSNPQLQLQSKQPPAVASELERTVVWPRVADKLLKHAADEFK